MNATTSELMDVSKDVFELVSECEADSTLDPVSLSCRPCIRCGPNAHARRPCDSKRDTQCECNRDFYYDDADLMSLDLVCRPCDLCPHGWGAHQPCSPHRNSKCSRCSTGTYSSLLSATLNCFPCTTCKRHQHVTHNCTPIHDTVCVDVERPHKSQMKPVSSVKVLSSTPGYYHHHHRLGPPAEADHASVWPIYSALLLTLLLATIAYFVLKRWKLNSSSAAIVSRPRPPAILTPATNVGDELYRDVCRSKRRLLETMLMEDGSGRGNWKHLAVYLGYSAERITEMECKNKAHSVSRRLLNDWANQRQHSATVSVLVSALNAIWRRDVVAVLCTSNSRRCVCANSCHDNAQTHTIVGII